MAKSATERQAERLTAVIEAERSRREPVEEKREPTPTERQIAHLDAQEEDRLARVRVARHREEVAARRAREDEAIE
jgi:hypothetical protein